MNWTSIVAIYFLFWVMGCYIALRFWMQTDHEAGNELLPGQADSAPANFRPVRIIVLGTIIATLTFGLYYANWTYEWVTMDDLDLFGIARDHPAGR